MLKDCDPEALGVVVDFMYGTDLTDMVMMHSANSNFVPLIVMNFKLSALIWPKLWGAK